MSGDRRQDRGRAAASGGINERKNSAMRIMDALSGVDEELLERCEQSGQSCDRYPRPLWQQARAWAAVLCLAVVGAASFGGYRLMQDGRMGSASGEGENMAYSLEMVERGVEDETVREEGAVQDTAGLERAEAQIEEGDEWEEQRQESTTEAGQNKNQSAAGTEDLDSGRGTEAAEEAWMVDSDGCPPLQAQKLTETEARDTEELGSYIPTVLPKGYGFESASRNLERQEENLTLCWSRGMDSILLGIEKGDSLPDTVDISRAEAYDVRLYEIPYGETVPEEYREIFQDPVFAIEDMSLEVIKSRVVSYDDRGDTDTPRGNFKVLYPNGVLVRFNGRGTPEEIWEMFCSMGE